MNGSVLEFDQQQNLALTLVVKTKIKMKWVVVTHIHDMRAIIIINLYTCMSNSLKTDELY